MSATLEITCPKCGKDFKVPAEFAGKTIRCKNCQTAFQVPPAGGGPARPVAARPAGAKPAAPVAARPAAPVAAKPPAADAPIPFKADDPPPENKSRDVDDDDETNPYGVIKESDVPRCPFCAKELDPPDAKICLNCGFSLLGRRRHETKQVYETSGGDYFMHWLPGIGAAIFILILIAFDTTLWIKANEWLGPILETGDKDTLTNLPKYYVKPWCCPLWVTIFFTVIVLKAGRVVVRRLITNWKPEEMKKVE
ncbi:hypothetical protein [Fimbriiglobus ruber]|uniref:Zinc finger/thioredoxin putative domain-containing protein n=1 Tax=Fimbriiglobus ruber TaxID=1908690 RepID=A0A225D7I8_9BACT|nr:hypothetical protein [Fimbriiglobus ruber]OWK37531.1 hypothetical protein FRUB_06651 [Fimbriiglobus ruber]